MNWSVRIPGLGLQGCTDFGLKYHVPKFDVRGLYKMGASRVLRGVQSLTKVPRDSQTP